MAEQLLAQLSTEYGFTIYAVEFTSPAGQAFARWGGIKFPPGIFINMQPVSYGRPSEGRLRQELERRRALAGHSPGDAPTGA